MVQIRYGIKKLWNNDIIKHLMQKILKKIIGQNYGGDYVQNDRY